MHLNVKFIVIKGYIGDRKFLLRYDEKNYRITILVDSSKNIGLLKTFANRSPKLEKECTENCINTELKDFVIFQTILKIQKINFDDYY